MNLLKNFWRAVFKPLALINDYKNNPKPLLSVLVVAITCLFNAVAAPLAYQLFNHGAYEAGFSIGMSLQILAVSIVSFLLSCLLFRLLAMQFKKQVKFVQILSTWGISFLPTLLCIAAVEASEAGFYLFMGNMGLSLVFSTFLILLLAWKIILFFMELGVVLGLKGRQTAWAVVIAAVVYVILMIVSFNLGLKVPML